MYQHQLDASICCPPQPGKVVCVGRNYAEHARELNNPVESSPLVFIKPATAVVSMAPEFRIPHDRGAVHHELEMALLIGSTLSGASREEALSAIVGVGLALDLTLRDIQSQLKQKGHPWERAKSFDGACPLSQFVAPGGLDLQNQTLTLERNGIQQQHGNTADMLFPIDTLIAGMSDVFTLLPGDVVLTGTPAGVGPLAEGDSLIATLGDVLRVECRVAAPD